MWRWVPFPNLYLAKNWRIMLLFGWGSWGIGLISKKKVIE